MNTGGPRKSIFDEKQFDVYYGVVTDNKDPDKKGRIKCKVPTLQQDVEESLDWGEIVTPMIGKKFGFYTLPDIGDQVVVAFIQGDIHKPIILGGVYNKTDTPPEHNDDKGNNFRGYRSRQGARMIFDDSDKTKIVFADKSGKHTIGIGQFEKASSGDNVCEVPRPRGTGDKGVAFSSLEGDIEITCKNGTLKITADKNILVDIEDGAEISAGKDLSFEGQTAELISSSDAQYDGPQIKIN